MDSHPSQSASSAAAGSSSSSSSGSGSGSGIHPAEAKSRKRPREDLQRQVEASERRRSILIATTHAVARMEDVFQTAEGLKKVEWPLVDVNLVLRDGRRFHTAAAASLRTTAQRSAGWKSTVPAFTYSLQTTILNKLLEYAPTASSLQPEQPRDADELLQWMVIELADSCGKLLEPFIRMLVNTLHKHGFDLDRRDAAGRTLLTAYATADQNEQTIEVERQLMRLGADASKAGSDGRSPPFIWVNQGTSDLVESVLVGGSAVRCPGVQQRVDLWQRDAEGRTLLECMQAKGACFGPSMDVLAELQQYWVAHERPLLQSLLTLHASLIVDLARLTLDYIDGGAEAK